MITEDYVSFEIAKLLKERGFDWHCTKFYNNLNLNRTFKLYNAQQFEGISTVSNKMLDDCFLPLQLKSIGYTAPTLQMAMKWLREVHHIYIQINLYLVPKGYGADIIHIDSMDTLAYVRKEDESQYDTYEQAAEAAIKYYLENLI